MNNSLIVTHTGISNIHITKTRGLIELIVEMRREPLTDVMYIVSTSDPNEAVIEYPSVLVFHTHNWDAPEHVRVQGVDDGVNDGDGNFTVIFTPQPLHNSPYWDYLGGCLVWTY